MPSTTTDAYRLFDTSVVSDALDEHGVGGVITGLEPVDPSHAAVGRAQTLRFEATDAPESETNFPFAMLEELAADRVLVVDGVGPDVSCWGGNASSLAAAAGTNGVVVDGGFRDASDVRESDLPLFARSPTPRTGQRRVTVEEVGEPVEIGGVTVASEDVVVADATGVVVVPGDHAAAVVDTAEEILAEELLLEEKIANGATVADLRRDDHAF